MKRYLLYIKSHSAYPDWEQEVLADTPEDAADKFYELLRGEYDLQFIKDNMVAEDEENR